MAIEICTTCDHSWDAARRPMCPNCQTQHWQSLPNLLRPKHDPNQIQPLKVFRTVVPYDFPASASVYLWHVAANGSAFVSLRNRDYFEFAQVGPQMSSGSTVAPGSTTPTTPHDGFVIVQAHQPKAHIFAQDLGVIQQRVAEGKYLPLQSCVVRGCPNLRVPPGDRCVEHSNPPLARGPI